MATEHQHAHVLKYKHSMLGKSLLPVLAKMKDWDPQSPVVELCRLQEGNPLEEYELVCLRNEFQKLTGESVKDAFLVCGMKEHVNSVEYVRQLIHFTILEANHEGTPHEQSLQNDAVLEVLKYKHSMHGKSLLPVLAKMKGWDPQSDVGELCRLKQEVPLDTYKLVDLRTEFEKLTGESVKNVFAVCDMDENEKSVRQLLHFTILQANLVGTPDGQTLQDDGDNSQQHRAGVTQNAGVSGPIGAAANSVRSVPSGNIQVTQESDAIKIKIFDMQVDEALANVRNIDGRLNVTSPHV